MITKKHDQAYQNLSFGDQNFKVYNWHMALIPGVVDLLRMRPVVAIGKACLKTRNGNYERLEGLKRWLSSQRLFASLPVFSIHHGPA